MSITQTSDSFSSFVVSTTCVVVGVVCARATRIHVSLLLVGVRELQTPDVVFVESIALERVDDDGCLLGTLKVCKAEDHFLIWTFLSWNQADGLEASEWTEYV